jgi:hypothetical protein
MALFTTKFSHLLNTKSTKKLPSTSYQKKSQFYSVPDTPGSLFSGIFTVILQYYCIEILFKRENHSYSAVQNLFHIIKKKKTVQPLVRMPTVGRLKKKLSRRVPMQIEIQSRLMELSIMKTRKLPECCP